MKDHGFNPFLEKGEGTLKGQGRPPLFLELLAFSFVLFGNSLIVAHSLVILFSFLAVLFTHLLGKLLYATRVGFFSSLFLFFSPLYFAQSGILNLEIPLTALTLMTIYFALKENKWMYLISAGSLVLTKETGMLILFPVLLVILSRYYGRPECRRNIFIYSLPFVFLFLWLLACKIHMGWFLYPFHMEIMNFSSSPELFETAMARFLQMFFRNGQWFLSLVILTGIWKWIKDVQQDKEKQIIIFGGIVVYFIFFSIYSAALDRYILPIYPLFYILFSRAIDVLLKGNWRLSFIALLLVSGLFIINWRGHRPDVGVKLETNMEYLDFVDVHKKATAFIQNRLSDRHILTDWPQIMELRYPFEGYVEKKIKASNSLEGYDLREIDIVYIVPNRRKTFTKLVDRLELKRLARFEQNGKAAEIYELIKD